MNKERYNQIIDEAYENYSKEYEKDNSIGILLLVKRVDNKLVYKKLDKESFTGLCEHDKSFSERWGLTIEERELSHDERIILINKKLGVTDTLPQYYNTDDEMDKNNVPTKLITVTYNNETIEFHE
jgi:hypothetical protein